MKFSLTRDEVSNIMRDHFKSYGEVKEVRLMPHGDHLVEVTVAAPPGLAEASKPAHELRDSTKLVAQGELSILGEAWIPGITGG